MQGRISWAVHAVAAAALAFMLAACGDKPASEQAAKPAIQPADQAGPKAAEPPAPITDKKAAEPPSATREAAPSPGQANAALADKVKAAFDADPALRALAVDVVASAGAVTLYGTADTPANRDKAAKVASGVDGVKSVQNQIVIVRGS
jgi:hyperosmotically inducible periplasmic protein